MNFIIAFNFRLRLIYFNVLSANSKFIEDGATEPENQEPDDRRGALDAAKMCRDREEGGTGEGGL